MHRFLAPLLNVALIINARTWSCGAFISPITTNIKCSTLTRTNYSQIFGNHHRTNYLNSVHSRKEYRTHIALKENDEDDEKAVEDDTMVDEELLPSILAKVTSGIFYFFSYCIQFLGVFFGCGLILNLLGFGYTVDLEHGLVIDRIQNIRNEVQFEREIEREERAELKGSITPSSKYIIAPNVPENNIVGISDK